MSKDPWGLTEEEYVALQNLVRYGSVKASSQKSPETLGDVYAAIRSARKRMSATSTVHAALMWDRWSRVEHGKDGELAQGG